MAVIEDTVARGRSRDHRCRFIRQIAVDDERRGVVIGYGRQEQYAPRSEPRRVCDRGELDEARPSLPCSTRLNGDIGNRREC